MATSSKRNDEFCEACSGSEIKGLPLSIWGGFGLPKCGDVFLFRRLSIQLSLGRLLSSRNGLCLTGREEFNPFRGWVNCRSARPSDPRCLFHLRQRILDYSTPRCLFSLRQQVSRQLASFRLRAAGVWGTWPHAENPLVVWPGYLWGSTVSGGVNSDGN